MTEIVNGHCIDYPACGHESGDCQGLKYGSDESIIASVHTAWNTGHGYCDHQEGIYNCEDVYEDEEDDLEDDEKLRDTLDTAADFWQEDSIIDASEP